MLERLKTYLVGCSPRGSQHFAQIRGSLVLCNPTHDLLSRAAGRQHLSFLTELSGVLGKTLFEWLALFETVTPDDHELLRSLREGGSAWRSHHR
jgi:hypothetical protein